MSDGYTLEAYSSFHINVDNERVSIVNEEIAIKKKDDLELVEV